LLTFTFPPLLPLLLAQLNQGPDLVIETVTFEELSMLAVGFQGLVEEPLPLVVGGAPGEAQDDADKAPDEVVMLPPPTNPGRLVCWRVSQRERVTRTPFSIVWWWLWWWCCLTPFFKAH